MQSIHTSKEGGWLVVPGGVALSYVSADFLLKRPPAPANGEMGGVVPSGEAGGVLAALLGDEGYPAGRLIMMLRVTFTGVVSSLPEAGEGGTNAAAASTAGSLILTAAGRAGCLRRRPRPVSGRGPATVSSHSLSRSPIPLRRSHPTATASARPPDLVHSL